MPDGLVSQVPPGEEDVATRVHHQMLLLLRSAPGKRGLAAHRTQDVDQRPLVHGLNALMAPLLRKARRSLAALSASQCEFACEIEDHGGDLHHWTSTFEGVPVCNDQLTALRLIDGLAKLPATQQALVVQMLSLERDLDLTRINLNFARKDGQADKALQLQGKIAELTSGINALKRSYSRAVQPWLVKNRSHLGALRNTARIAPVALAGSASSGDLLRGAVWYLSLGESMYMPLPLDEDADPASLSRWRRLWEAYEECGKGILVVAHWVRALGSLGPHDRCELCFRHRGPGMRCHCAVHKRSGRKRFPRREQFVAREYAKTVSGAPLPSGDGDTFQQIMSGPPVTAMVLSAQRLGLPAELTKPALRLGSLLRWLHPILSTKQQGLIAEQFLEMLQECMEPFNAKVFESEAARRENITLRRRAVQKVNWGPFFGRVFASVAKPDIAVGAGKGQPIDIDHPLASTHLLISEGKLPNDLLRFRAWVEADFAIDKLVYLDDATILEEFQRQLARLGKRPSLRELGKVFKASPETIRHALLRAVHGEGVSPSRRRHSRSRDAPDVVWPGDFSLRVTNAA